MSFLEVLTDTCILALLQLSKTANTFFSFDSTFFKKKGKQKIKISYLSCLNNYFTCC